MTLLICPVRPGDTNEELRYAMRSWEANLHLGYEAGGGDRDHIELLIVGHVPPWVKPDHHVTGNQYRSVPLAVFDNILRGSEQAIDLGLGDEPVLYMNDDFFCMDPVGCVLPVRRNASLKQQYAHYPENAGTWWPRSLRLTAAFLAERGFPDPPSFEAHRPLSASPSAMYSALMEWNDTSKHWTRDTVPQWRTVYGVLNKVEAYPVVDAKLGLRSATGVGTPWVSTSDQSWRRYAPEIKKRFQKPSRWEI